MKHSEARDNLRAKNPFLETLATELIEDPKVYKQYFSQRVLVGEALEIFRLMNVVVRGPQGSGKSMLLNLVKHEVLGQWFREEGTLPEGIRAVNPYVGISINLQRINFHLFGRRSFRPDLPPDDQRFVDVSCAADFINHYVFLEFALFIKKITLAENIGFRQWLGFEGSCDSFVASCREWECWGGYYTNTQNIDDLIASIKRRLRAYTDYLNGNVDSIPEEVVRTKEDIGIPSNRMGIYLNESCNSNEATESKRIGFFVVIDQYEVLRELNPSHGDELIKLVNTALKRRDPFAFYKIGVRTHDWDGDKGIIGANATLELNRDFLDVSLDRIFKRRENTGGKFTEFIEDVATRRVNAVLKRNLNVEDLRRMFGTWDPELEVSMYSKRLTIEDILSEIPLMLRGAVRTQIERKPSVVECQLALSWCSQQTNGGTAIPLIQKEIKLRPWWRENWRKERVDLSLFQLASRYRQQRVYFGAKNVIELAGNNVTAFLLIAGKIWDMAAKRGVDPVSDGGVDPRLQNKAIQIAAAEWSEHDRRVQSGGEYRHGMLAKLAELVLTKLKSDSAMSNPGFTGVSFAEVDLRNNEDFSSIYAALSKAVSWAMLEEREHKSKDKGREQQRIKYYFHPLLCARFGIPVSRVKEPIYIRELSEIKWVFDPSESGPKKIVSTENPAQQDFGF